MSKTVQLSISVVIILCCIGVLVNSFKFKGEENTGKSYKKVNTIPQEAIENTDIYDAFLKNFDCQGEEYYYSFIELAGYDHPVLLLSDGVYNSSNKSKVALWTDIYYPVNNEIINFGSISSGGTAYPISADTTGIYTAGGHEAAKYGLDIPNRKMKLINKYIMFFHKVGQEVKSITVRVTGDENKIVSEEEFDKAITEYGNAKIIFFKRLC